jgi:hypothetical protein
MSEYETTFNNFQYYDITGSRQTLKRLSVKVTLTIKNELENPEWIVFKKHIAYTICLVPDPYETQSFEYANIKGYFHFDASPSASPITNHQLNITEVVSDYIGGWKKQLIDNVKGAIAGFLALKKWVIGILDSHYNDLLNELLVINANEKAEEYKRVFTEEFARIDPIKYIENIKRVYGKDPNANLDAFADYVRTIDTSTFFSSRWNPFKEKSTDAVAKRDALKTDLSLSNYDYNLEQFKQSILKQIAHVKKQQTEFTIRNRETYIAKFIEGHTPQNTGGSKKKLILGRWRKVTKVGRKSMITYKGKMISITEARALERKKK